MDCYLFLEDNKKKTECHYYDKEDDCDPISIIQNDLLELEQEIQKITDMYQDMLQEPLFRKECRQLCQELDEEIDKKISLLNMFIYKEKENLLETIDTSSHRVRCSCFVDGEENCKMVNCPFKEKNCIKI